MKKCIDEDLTDEITKNGSRLYELEYRLKSPIKYIKDLARIIREGRYDIVHAHGNSCTLAIEMLAAKMENIKIRIAHSHNTSSKYKIAHMILRKTFDKNYTYGLACSREAGKWLFKEAPFTVLKNGIDSKKYIFNKRIREEYRKKLDLENCKVIGHVGSFNYQKNHTFLIEIFKELYEIDSTYRLICVGDGALRKEIEDNIKNYGLDGAVLFTGKTKDVPQLMQAMDLFVMPSRYEGLPLTLIEAQAAGLPCFVSDLITNEVNITNLVNFISLNNSAKEWAKIIHDHVMFDRDLLKNDVVSKISQEGYDIRENAKKLKEIYMDLISGENNTL